MTTKPTSSPRNQKPVLRRKRRTTKQPELTEPIEEVEVVKLRKKRPVLHALAWLALVSAVTVSGFYIFALATSPTVQPDRGLLAKIAQPKLPEPKFGTILSVEAPTVYSAQATKTLINQTNKAFATSLTSGITKRVIRYTSSDQDGRAISVYARVYLPNIVSTKKLPIFAFAPGTTGIDDHCAASLEQPAKANWANYDSLMAAYAAQGYAVVVTDYEGMRDSSRIHHYMVGELEGRAVLDSVRAVKNLTVSKNMVDPQNVFVAGYSQGGHAALWADKLNADYAPDVALKGVVGYGPVSDVGTTLTDITKGANINWFGPYVLYSYRDYYRTGYDISRYLLPQWEQSLNTDIAQNCIDTVLKRWGHSPAALYQPAFLSDMGKGTLASNFQDLSDDLDRNQAGNTRTVTAKRINHGQLDNVVLVSQSQALQKRLCSLGGGSVSMQVYATATHYDTMVKSYADTLSWMKLVRAGQTVPSTCS